jgi:glycosyltransferase involved in cell wall biosynthesis
VALVHDWLNQYGGAERVLEVMHALFPAAPIYTSLYAPAALPAAYRAWDIRTSFMQRLPLAKRYHQPFMPLYPLAFEQFDLSDYDLVLSNKSGFCHGVITRPQTTHVCYCLTTTRFLWQFHDYARRERIGRLGRLLLPLFLAQARVWDRAAADRVDDFVAISRVVAARVAKIYRRPATVIHPPIDARSFRPADERGDYYLVVSRLIPYKRIDLAVRACTALGRPLKVVGTGRDAARLAALAGPTVAFLGRVSEDALRRLYAGCRALLFPGEEDFGLAPLEAQACGRPVIALAAGGALDTVRDGVTGVLFKEPTVAALTDAIERFERLDLDPRVLRAHAAQFDVPVFARRLLEHLATVVQRGRPAGLQCGGHSAPAPAGEPISGTAQG